MAAVDHIRAVLLDDLRELVTLAKMSPDDALVDRVCVELAHARGESIALCIAGIAEELGFEIVNQARQATMNGSMQ